MKKLLLLVGVVGLLSGCLYSPYEMEHGGYPHSGRHDREGGDGGHRGGGDHGGDRQGGDRGD
jgi:hypothetical protein